MVNTHRAMDSELLQTRADKQEVIAMIDCSAVITRQPGTGAKISKCSGHFSAHKKAHKTLDLECLSMTYGVVRAFQVIANTLLCTEKAGVGGSTPSLATTFQSTWPNSLGGSSPL